MDFGLSRRGARWCVLGLLAVFVGLGVVQYWDAEGDDLSASYVGCRLVADGNASHLYAHDAHDFAAVGRDDPWQAAADAGEFDGFLHPYVQTPLWAYGLRPMCMRMSFAGFERSFLFAILLSFAACVFLVAFYWAPEMLHPLPIGLVLVWLWFSQPFQYAMGLMQTHVLFLLMTVSALMLAERRRPGWAGLLLACAAAVKVTPGVLVVYWVLTRRWKAAGWMVLWTGVLWVVTMAVAGPRVVGAYTADLQRVSHVLLLSANNQSFAVWWMERRYPAEEALRFQIYPLPTVVRVVSAMALVGLVAAGGLLDRWRARVGAAPMGALIGLLAATVFAPIAWTHYAIVLIAPLPVLGAEAWRRWSGWRSGARPERQSGRWSGWGSWWIGGGVMVIAAMNLRPLAADLFGEAPGRFAVLRGQFYAEVLCMVLLAVVGWTTAARRRSEGEVSQGGRWWVDGNGG